MSNLRYIRSLSAGLLLLSTALYATDLVHVDIQSGDTQPLIPEIICEPVQSLAAVAALTDPATTLCLPEGDTPSVVAEALTFDAPRGFFIRSVPEVLSLAPAEFFAQFTNPSLKATGLHPQHVLRYIRRNAHPASALHTLFADTAYDTLTGQAVAQILQAGMSDLTLECQEAILSTTVDRIAIAYDARRETVRFLKAFASDNDAERVAHTWKKFVEASVPYLNIHAASQPAADFLWSWRDASATMGKGRINAARILSNITKYEDQLDPQTCSFMLSLYKQLGAPETTRRLSYLLEY